MLNSLRRRARKVGLGIHKQRGEECYMVYDLMNNTVVSHSYYYTYPWSIEDVEETIARFEEDLSQ